jgi:regulator of RNase E activity RraB
MVKKLMFALLILATANLFVSCAGGSDKKKAVDYDDELALPDSLSGEGPLKLSEEIIGDVIQNISSPVEMANLIKSTGVDFSQQILNSPENISTYSTSFKRALNLGVFSADLGYINSYDKSNIVVSYLLAVKNLADGIRVGQFFDFETLKRMATNSSNLDSLMQMSVSSFNQMDSYLRQQNRSNVSALVITGAWIEGLYIAANVIEQTNDEELINRLGEQKEIVDILYIILQNYDQNSNFKMLIDHLSELKIAYKSVKITKEVGEPKTLEQDGMLIIVQDEMSHVQINPEDLGIIIEKIKEIRAEVVS